MHHRHLPFAVPRPGTPAPANSTVEAILRALPELSSRMQRRVLGLVDDLADAEKRGETVLRINVEVAPK